MNSNYKNITGDFQQLYFPQKALLMYAHLEDQHDIYIEAYDCDDSGKLINAHPLSLSEIRRLAELLKHAKNVQDNCFRCGYFLPENLLFLNSENKWAIWYTPAVQAKLYFSKSLKLKNTYLPIPPLIWKASESQLYVYAIQTGERPTPKTPLFNAPFFNLYRDGRVCMGTVDVETSGWEDISMFMNGWQQYFYNSDFSQTIDNGHEAYDLPKLYRQLAGSQHPFPLKELKPSMLTLKDLLP